MDSKEDEGVSIGGRQRKFGLPGWMVNNIERLNFVTDFEQYGSSPPEHESFLTDYTDAPMANDNICNTVESKNLANGTAAKKAVRKQYLDSPPPYLLKHDELFSSPDSTPCATPEPSPVVRRKVSIPHPQDTVLTNPGRWFYLGKVKKPEGKKKVSGSHNEQDQPNKPAIKLVISNFDLNAVSPTSW